MTPLPSQTVSASGSDLRRTSVPGPSTELLHAHLRTLADAGWRVAGILRQRSGQDWVVHASPVD